MSVLPTPSPARRRVLTPYVMIWLAIASFALAYLALLGLKPQMFASAASNATDIDQKLTQARRDMERGLADLDPLKRTVGEVKMDVSNLKVAVEEGSVRDQVILEKVAALESAAQNAPESTHTKSATASTPAAVPPTPKPNPKKASGATTFAPPVGPSAEDMRAHGAQKSAKVINGANSPSGTDAIETGSIQHKAALAAKPRAAAAKPQTVGVILATGPSVDSLRLNWSILTDRYADAVHNMHPRYVVKGNANNRTYGLVVGPLASTAEAKSLCKDMETRGMPCEVSAYRGNAL
jgi:hypothetical protein